MNIDVLIAQSVDLEDLASLFLAYSEGSVSKERSLTVSECLVWIQERHSNGDGVFFLAKSSSKIVGFATLYPGFSSISLKRRWILNDLFVSPKSRNLGIGSKLMIRAHDYVRETNAESVELETARINIRAQELYKKLGYKEETLYRRYYWYPDNAL